MGYPVFTGAARPAASDLDDALQWSRATMLDARAFGVVGDFSGTTGTDNWTALQAAIDEAYGIGNCVVRLPPTPAMVDGPIEVPQGVLLAGTALGGFANPYVSTYAGPRGSAVVAAPGLNADVVTVTCRLTLSGGVLYDTGHGTRNVDARHCGGVQDMMVWGMRSTVATPPSTADLNTAGNALTFKGARRAVCRNVTTMFAAVDGLVTTGRDYGTGLLGCNNMQMLRPVALSCGRYGHNLSLGDSDIIAPEAGYNGSTGMVVTLGNCQILGGSSWNNLGDGLYAGPVNLGSLSSIQQFRAYDNDGGGVGVYGSGTGTTVPELRNILARGNGRNASKPAAARFGIRVGSATAYAVVTGCTSQGWDQTSTSVGVSTQQYGFLIENTTYPLVWGADNVARGNAIADYDFASSILVQSHLGTPVPAMSMAGDITMGGYSLRSVAQLSFGGWSTVSTITSGVLPISAGASLYALNYTGAQSITDLTYAGSGSPLIMVRNLSADPVTLVHNVAKVRLPNSANVVLNQFEGLMLMHVSGNVFQAIGVAA